MLKRHHIATCLFALASLVLFALPAHASLQSCVAGLKRAAIKAGVKPSIANRALNTVKYDEKVIRFSRRQPENKTYIWDYMAFLVDAKRISTGKAMMEKHNRTLRAVEKAYGVDRYIVAALWGSDAAFIGLVATL